MDRKGWVRVDGKVVSVLGSKVLPHQKVTVERQASAEQAQRVTILINKPMGYVSGQAEDGYKPAVVLVNEQPLGRRPDRDALPPAPAEEPGTGRPAGHRLGRPAGADPGWPHRQAADRRDSAVDKEYLVRVQYTRPASCPKRPQAPEPRPDHGRQAAAPGQGGWQNEDQLRFTLREGKKRQIRRMCDMVGLKVIGLKRVRIGGVKLGELPTGQWRYLRPDEKF
jgi:23S rRNA pseudouridine2604 synthase